MVNVEMLWWARWTATSSTASRSGREQSSTPARERARGPVVLVTLHGAPLAPGAADLAVDLAVENGLALVVLHVEERFAGGRTAGLHLAAPAVVSAGLRAPAERAAAAGLDATVTSLAAARPLGALAEAVAALAPELVVLGADPAGLSRVRGLTPRAYRRVARVLERRTTCLLWRADRDGPATIAARRPSGPAGR